MSQPKPPFRKLPWAAIEENVARGPHTPVPEPDTLPTAPPPAPMPMAAPRGLQGPRGRVVAPPLVAPAAPELGSETDERTLHGIGPDSLPPTRDKLDSVEIATGTLLDELSAEHSRRKAAEAELAALKAQKSKHPGSAPPSAPSEKQLRKAQIHAALVKLIGALTVAATACATYLGVTAHTQIGQKADNAEARATLAKAGTDRGRDLQKETLEYLAAEQLWRDCLLGQFGSATVRGTGHLVTDAPMVNADDLWAEQNAPPVRPGPLWPRWTWHTIKSCGNEPHVPALVP